MPIKAVYQERKAAGLCVNCGGMRDGTALVCSGCYHKHSLGRMGRLMQKGQAAMASTVEILDLLAEDRMRAEESVAKMEMARALRQRTTVDIIRDAIIASTSHIDLTDVPRALGHDSGAGSPETQVALLGDIQYGRVTPSFNTEIARKRLAYYGSKIVRIGDLHRKAYPVDDLVVLGLGDMIDNENLFPTQPYQVEIPVFQQVSELAEMVGTWLVDLADEYKNVSFYGVPGNHGRVSRFNNPVTNWDNMFYMVLESILRTHPRIKVKMPKTLYDWYQVVDVRGHGLLMVHGDQFRSWLGYPWYAATRKAQAWLASIPEPFQYMIHGHFHTQMMGLDINGAELIANGTFLSGDEYSLRVIGSTGSIKQITFGVNEHHGISWRYGILLDDMT